MKQCYHNEISKECAVLSNSEHANFFLSLITTIGKREYTPGILEMTAIYQLYTRKIADNLLGIQKVWYMSGIH